MKAICFCILFTFAASMVSAQEQFVEKPAQLLTSFHFQQLSGGIIIIRARLNDIPDTLNFILDTGSGGISLDSTTCAEFKIQHAPSGRTINGIAGIRDVDFAKHNILKLPGLQVNDLDFYINNYEVLSSVYGQKIDGIIGYSFFSRYIVKVDFDSLDIEVFRPGYMRYPSDGHLLHPIFTALPIETMQVRDARSILENFYLDTGAGLCFLVSKEFADDSSFIMKKRIPVPIQAEGLGGKKRMLITIIKEIKLGPYKFRRVPTHILDDEYNATSYPYIGGLVGNDILRRFNLVINYSKREIHLTPNSHFSEAFDYSYTGMSLYQVDRKIMVDDVIRNGPADKAGFHKDDIVLGIGTNFSNNITQYKNILQSPGERFRVVVFRDKAPLIINFRIGRIF